MNGRHLFAVSVVIAITAIGIFAVTQRSPDSETDLSNPIDDSLTPGPDPIASSEGPNGSPVQTDDSDEFEVIYGMRVRKDRNCTIEQHYIEISDGTVVEGFSCVPNEPPKPGVYDSYDDDTLAVMSYADSLAAETLGKRLAEEYPDEARSLLLRSVALKPQNTQPILWLASGYYSLVSKNGEPAFYEMSENYLLARIAEELGTPGEADYIRQMLIEAGLEEQEFQELEYHVREDLNHIRNIQVEVTGTSELPETSL